ncbi:MAG: TraB domain-containing protein [Methanomassiliicoccaceae archaeon]|jgi:pheromone shutdown protein TraB|nr:TraB domain-containing protein [Methanomassiliicoccaceae archaeon]
MITLVGVGHVFRIAEPVAFIVKNIWPDAVLVELDEKRYGAAPPERSEGSKGDDRPKAFRSMNEYQGRMAEEYGSQRGAEFIAAIETGKNIGAAIELIDVDANKMMDDVWDEMPFFERTRFRLSLIADRLWPKKRVARVHREFTEDEDAYIAWMRKRYPTLVRKVIDERNVHMAGKINEASERYGNIVAVIGDGHVEGIAKMLRAGSVRKIRLKTLMDTESMNSLRAELWSGRAKEEKE